MLKYGVLTKRELNCLKYRWEFLRRNQEYQKDYLYITDHLKVTDIIKNSYSDLLVKKVLDILSKWGLLNPIPPKLSFDALLKSDKKLKSFYIDSLSSDENAILIYESPDGLSSQDLYIKGSMVKLHVDMKFSKEKILDEFSVLINKWQTQLRKLSRKFPKAKPDERLQINQYEKYLRMYDHHKKGMSFSQLAKKFYSGYIETSGKDYAERKVSRDINGCLKLIHGGYRQIR